MNPPLVSLCPEITRADALRLMDWLEDEAVTRHLSDPQHISRFIGQVIERVRLPVLTHLFNQGGRFFMACDREDRPVGFVRLVQAGTACELVLVIGQRAQWGRRLGAGALREALKIAFFEMRAERLEARIHPDNARSLKLFQRFGFVPDGPPTGLQRLTLHAARYLRLLRERIGGPGGDICITGPDQDRLRELVGAEPAPAVFELEHEIERAAVVDPDDADAGAGRLSVRSGLGTAILGCREGARFDWRIPDRTRHIRIGRLLYQPEAAGHFHL